MLARWLIAHSRSTITGWLERTHVVQHDGGYLYAEFRSRRMGFVDDVEFPMSEPESEIH